jgi:hypothetical protein
MHLRFSSVQTKSQAVVLPIGLKLNAEKTRFGFARNANKAEQAGKRLTPGSQKRNALNELSQTKTLVLPQEQTILQPSQIWMMNQCLIFKKKRFHYNPAAEQAGTELVLLAIQK